MTQMDFDCVKAYIRYMGALRRRLEQTNNISSCFDGELSSS